MHIGGAPGSGKTHLGKQFKSLYPNLKVIDTDQLKALMIKTNSEIIEQLMHLHKYGIPEGSNVGLKSFDENLTFVKGGCTDITGYPFYGKSLFLKEMLMNLGSCTG